MYQYPEVINTWRGLQMILEKARKGNMTRFFRYFGQSHRYRQYHFRGRLISDMASSWISLYLWNMEERRERHEAIELSLERMRRGRDINAFSQCFEENVICGA
jgi:hypothetical protein